MRRCGTTLASTAFDRTTPHVPVGEDPEFLSSGDLEALRDVAVSPKVQAAPLANGAGAVANVASTDLQLYAQVMATRQEEVMRYRLRDAPDVAAVASSARMAAALPLARLLEQCLHSQGLHGMSTSVLYRGPGEKNAGGDHAPRHG